MSQQSCRLCLNPSSGSYKNINDSNYSDQFKLVIPEVDLMLTESPMICLNCLNLLETAYTFKRNCLETEDKLKLLLSTSNMEEKMQDEIFHQKEEMSDDNFFDDSIKHEPSESDYDLESKMDIQPIERQDIKIYICKYCGKKFSSQRNWYAHCQHHTGRRYICDICSEGFDTRPKFIMHKQSHRGVNKCPICGKVFLYKAVLDRHTQQHNLCEKRVFECNVCGLQTKLKCKLMEHMRIHTGERPFKCSFCSKSFTQSSTLSTHVKGVHSKERPFTCEICGRNYAVKGQYTAHKRSHATDIPKNCVCSYCGKCYRIESKLQAHIKTHTGEKPIVCHVCSKRFSELNGLKKHMRTHTGEKPYECIICQKRFSQKYNMTIHYKSCLKRKTLSM